MSLLVRRRLLIIEAEQSAPVVNYMRPPTIDDDEPEPMTAMQYAMAWAGAVISGPAHGPLVDSTN